MRHAHCRWRVVLLLLVSIGATHALARSDQVDRVIKAATVLEEIMGAPDKAIPNSVLAKAEGLENLLGNQFKLGVDASVAAGPVGRDAEVSTDVQMRATILSYSRARGLFAGVTLKGTAIRRDKDSNEDFYGQPYETREIVLEGRVARHLPDSVGRWRGTLNRYAR